MRALFCTAGQEPRSASAFAPNPHKACNKLAGRRLAGFNYADKFDEPTEDGYIITTVEGTFSNSATSKDDADFQILIDSWSVAVFIYEYGWSQVMGSWGDTIYDVIIRDANGVEYETVAYLFEGYDRLYIDLLNSETYDLVVDILSKGGKVSFYIEEADASGVADTYLFTIQDTTGFDVAYEKMFGPASSGTLV